MVIKGRSRGNGKQLAQYLLGSRENDRAQVLNIRGTSRPHDLHKSLLEMSLTSELTKGVHGLYHAQINPAIGEDMPMSTDDWLTAVDILEKHLGFEGQKRIIVLHEKKGRVHAHVGWERYDHETGTLRGDGHNFRKHDKAREEIELTLGHKRTRQQEQEPDPDERKKADYKRELSKLWEQFPDGNDFIQEAAKAGYQIAAVDARRPWRVIMPDGKDEDLVRQLETAKTKDVRARLLPVRDELKTPAEILDALRARAVQKENTRDQEQPGSQARELSDSQDTAVGMLKDVQQRKQQPYTYTVTFTPSPLQRPAQHEPEPEPRETARAETESQDKAAAMLEHYRQRKAERERLEAERKRREAEQQAKQQQEDITDPAAEMLRKYRDRARKRGGLDYDL